MIEGILIGLTTALTFQNIFMVMIGCFFGTIIGMLPGLGPMTAIALMIPITYGFDPATGLILMAGVYYGAVFGGSTSSILLNAPGVPGTVATSFDGYPMAQQGKAGKALAIAAWSSFAGGTLAAIYLLFLAPSLSKVSLSFRSPDYFGLMILNRCQTLITFRPFLSSFTPSHTAKATRAGSIRSAKSTSHFPVFGISRIKTTDQVPSFHSP